MSVLRAECGRSVQIICGKPFGASLSLGSPLHRFAFFRNTPHSLPPQPPAPPPFTIPNAPHMVVNCSQTDALTLQNSPHLGGFSGDSSLANARTASSRWSCPVWVFGADSSTRKYQASANSPRMHEHGRPGCKVQRHL